MTITHASRTTIDESTLLDLKGRIERELKGNILPFWIRHAVDEANGGFYGAVTNDLRVVNSVPRSAVLCSRILWTYAAAYRMFMDENYLRMARWAYDYLTQHFWDRNHGGVYWSLDYRGNPVNDRKHIYAQAFAIYGLSEYFRATQDVESLRLAQELFRLIEEHSFDAVNGGNIECRSREWGALSDMRLSEKEPGCRKSMNTLLHLMEAYTNLMRIWNNAKLEAKQEELLGVFLRHVIDPDTAHLKLFFDDEWHSLSDGISFGHDIESSWLLVEAAEVLGKQEILAQARATAVRMAEAVYVQGLDTDGSLLYEAEGPGNDDKHWWVQAEAVAGFYNAYQISSQERFADAAMRLWNYIEDKCVDHTHGDWFKQLNRLGVPYAEHFKVGPWECPYHHSRTCFEMLARLSLQSACQ
jgi:mannobiose 2-epimerase